jgi:hypothetical protein
MNFQMMQKGCWKFDKNLMYLYITLISNDIITVLSFSVYEREISFYLFRSLISFNCVVDFSMQVFHFYGYIFSIFLYYSTSGLLFGSFL